MWDTLPSDLQAAVLDAFAVPDADGHWNPRLLHHLPSRQFLNRVSELHRRSLCYARALSLASTRQMDAVEFVDAVTRVAVDHVLLRRTKIAVGIMLTPRVEQVVKREVKRRHDTLRIWCALGCRPSCFHRSVAAEIIHEAKLGRAQTDRVVNLLCTLFVSLYFQTIPKIAHGQTSIKSVMHNHLALLRQC
tara:strand:+ start:315 stop:884 length:570 start_codon:yes stop_codon:yes gene_type:complete